MYERSYHQEVLKQDTPHKRGALKKILYAILGAGIVVGIIFCIRAPRFQIRTVVVYGTEVADPVAVSDYVLARLEGKYLWILPKSSIFLASPDHIRDQVSAAFPRFETVVVKRTSMSALSVQVQEYPGVYLWCDDACSFMDEQGTVFADAPYFSGSAYVKLYSGTRGAYPFRPMPDTYPVIVKELIKQLETVAIAPIELHFEHEHKLSVVFFHHGQRAELYIDPTSSIEETINALFSGLRTDPLADLYRSTSHVLQYIDVRFSNKVVYKFD